MINIKDNGLVDSRELHSTLEIKTRFNDWINRVIAVCGFEDGKEFLFKNLDITAPIKSEKDNNGVDYNIVCQGYLTIDRETSTAHISAEITFPTKQE